ncbi:ParB/RepB/Spo0J family partition protein, partial [uncultured Sulfitobacter sp.]|uniref:ParB/RepB/Spo0J family partition protein n=1 Tax=uncultured Sulfitobacter sp. TaxID=191468 RepID=UPI002611090F
MAKRRRLEAPSAAQLDELEKGFARETKGGALGPIPPIAQVAADAAASGEAVDPAVRAAQAVDRADAERYRDALADGLVVQKIAVGQVLMEAMPRDRVTVDAEAMEELKSSIRLYGLRLPVDLFELAEQGANGERYGLISGWRRLMAFRALAIETGDPTFEVVPAFVRDVGTGPKAYVAMVEENEIRANLSHYERGRIAVMATAHGAFASVEDAVNALYASGSKAKRSKIRSFAALHEELGDMLSFGSHLGERQGLRLVAAMRNGYTGQLREALEVGQGGDPASEWTLLEPTVIVSEEAGKPGKKKRPKTPTAVTQPKQGRGYHQLSNGISLMWDMDRSGYYIRLEGEMVDADVLEAAMDGLKRVLDSGS